MICNETGKAKGDQHVKAIICIFHGKILRES